MNIFYFRFVLVFFFFFKKLFLFCWVFCLVSDDFYLKINFSSGEVTENKSLFIRIVTLLFHSYE